MELVGYLSPTLEESLVEFECTNRETFLLHVPPAMYGELRSLLTRETTPLLRANVNRVFDEKDMPTGKKVLIGWQVLECCR